MAMMAASDHSSTGQKSLRETAASPELETLTDLRLITKLQVKELLLEAAEDMSLLTLWIVCWAGAYLPPSCLSSGISKNPGDNHIEWHFAATSLYLKGNPMGFSP